MTLGLSDLGKIVKGANDFNRGDIIDGSVRRTGWPRSTPDFPRKTGDWMDPVRSVISARVGDLWTRTAMLSSALGCTIRYKGDMSDVL